MVCYLTSLAYSIVVIFMAGLGNPLITESMIMGVHIRGVNKGHGGCIFVGMYFCNLDTLPRYHQTSEASHRGCRHLIESCSVVILLVAREHPKLSTASVVEFSGNPSAATVLLRTSGRV
jgi:hypothetical protein